MIQRLHHRLRSAPQGLLLFLFAVACLGVVSGIFETTFNNYLADTFNVTAEMRGGLELPRETPGFLVALMAGMLFFMAETRIGALCSLLTAAGVLILGMYSRSWTSMLVGMTFWSMGTHLFQPVSRSIALQMAREHAQGRRLGQVGAVGVGATIGGAAVVLVGMRYLHMGYAVMFMAAAVAAALSIPALMAMPRHVAQLTRPKTVIRARYWLYYVLCLLFGARKQIFITFGPWVLVKIFHQPAYVFAQLWIICAIIGVFFQPALGSLIDRVGERWVLIIDALVMALVTFAYGHLQPGAEWARYTILACYVVDQVSFSAGMARDTYLSKIALHPDDVAPTLSLGITINHAVSMSLPFFGGWLWDTYGYARVFEAAGVIAVIYLVFATMVKSRPGRVIAEALGQDQDGILAEASALTWDDNTRRAGK